MARKGPALWIQNHIWMKVTAVAGHVVYEETVPERHGGMETAISFQLWQKL